MADSLEELRRRLGPHHAPQGGLERLQSLPFAGRLRCDTAVVEAGSWQELLLDYEVGSSGIADGAWLKLTFRFYSDWALFQTHDPRGADYVSAEVHCGERLPGQSAATLQSLAVRFDQKGHERPFQKAVIIDLVDGYLNAGDHVLIRLGDRRQGGPGTRVQTFVEEGFRFRAYLDPLGSSRFVAVPGDVRIDVVAGPPRQLQLHAPRFARPGQPLRVVVALHDHWGNICRDCGGSVQLDHEMESNDAPKPSWTLPLPEQGWGRAEPEPLILATGRQALLARYGTLTTRALVTVADGLPAPRALYADLHVHAHDTVGTNSPAYNAAYARDVSCIDVFGYTANDFQISDSNWAEGVAAVNAFHEPGRFVVFPVQEWCGNSTAGGDHNVLFLGDAPPDFPYNARSEHNRTLRWNEELGSHTVELGRWPVEELWAAYIDAPEEHLLIPHVGGRRYIPDWHHPELERLVEICSAWGQFDWLYADVMRRGYRLGVAASGDEHRGRPGGGAPGVQVFGVRGGLTGVLADQLDRGSVGRALRARHTWATTGERTALLVSCAGHRQGDEFHHRGAARIDYRLLGDGGAAGWEELTLLDHTGTIQRRNLHREQGYASDLVRLRWGGARIRDRYRWATWRGRIHVLGTPILALQATGMEHPEEACWRDGATAVGFASETYGDADGVEITVADLAEARFLIEGTIEGFQKLPGGRASSPFVHAPGFRWEVAAEELLEQGELRLDLGGTDLFLALERQTRGPLPDDLAGGFTVEPGNGPHGFRPLYLCGRQRDGARVWSSALFIHFQED
jgi:hypothetical protein